MKLAAPSGHKKAPRPKPRSFDSVVSGLASNAIVACATPVSISTSGVSASVNIAATVVIASTVVVAAMPIDPVTANDVKVEAESYSAISRGHIAVGVSIVIRVDVGWIISGIVVESDS